ncbi:hypothetical protein [Streptomyces olivoreticuli]|nr:hypothetical protein [Streptomyces olivoreticuli]
MQPCAKMTARLIGRAAVPGFPVAPGPQEVGFLGLVAVLVAALVVLGP